MEVGEITKQEFAFMKVDYPITAVIYILPKIHKDLINPPGRPIISRIVSLTEKISTCGFFLKAGCIYIALLCKRLST